MASTAHAYIAYLNTVSSDIASAIPAKAALINSSSPFAMAFTRLM
jgi:hypothetical protein